MGSKIGTCFSSPESHPHPRDSPTDNPQHPGSGLSPASVLLLDALGRGRSGHGLQDGGDVRRLGARIDDREAGHRLPLVNGRGDEGEA